jgi:carbon monoxide dehydrogenase subunit G
VKVLTSVFVAFFQKYLEIKLNKLMSILFNRSLIIANPVEEVFGFISDPSNMPLIMPDIVRSEKIGDGPTKVGTRVRETRKMMNKEVTAEVEISRFEQPNKFGVISESMGISAEYVYTFTPVEKGTKVELEATIQARGIGKLLVPIFRSSMKKQDSEQLSNLKAYLEDNS